MKQQWTHTNNNSNMINMIYQLPNEIHPQIVDYLDIVDALSYQNTCKHLKDAVHLDLLKHASPALDQKLQKFHAIGDYYTGDVIRRWIVIDSLLFPTQVHTVFFTCNYKDQGWGNRKGNVYITELVVPSANSTTDSTECNYYPEDDDTFIGSNIVVQSDTAEHTLSFLCLKFKPKPGVRYAICYKVGGGGGHELHIVDPMLKSFIYSKSVKFANILYDSCQDSFMIEMIRAVLDEAVETLDAHKKETKIDNGTSVLSGRFFALFQSIGLDLKNKQHLQDARAVLEEYERFRDFQRSRTD